MEGLSEGWGGDIQEQELSMEELVTRAEERASPPKEFKDLWQWLLRTDHVGQESKKDRQTPNDLNGICFRMKPLPFWIKPGKDWVSLEHFLALYPVAAAFLSQLKSDLECF